MDADVRQKLIRRWTQACPCENRDGRRCVGSFNSARLGLRVRPRLAACSNSRMTDRTLGARTRRTPMRGSCVMPQSKRTWSSSTCSNSPSFASPPATNRMRRSAPFSSLSAVILYAPLDCAVAEMCNPDFLSRMVNGRIDTSSSMPSLHASKEESLHREQVCGATRKAQQSLSCVFHASQDAHRMVHGIYTRLCAVYLAVCVNAKSCALCVFLLI